MRIKSAMAGLLLSAAIPALAIAGSGPAPADGTEGRFAAEVGRMKSRWGSRLQADPYYNPNLTLLDESFSLAPRSRALDPKT